MRAIAISLGLLIAGVVLCTATAQGQNGPFSATRKMQGITRNAAASNSSTTTAPQPTPSDTIVSAPAVVLGPESASDAPSTDEKETAESDPASGHPTAPQQPTVKAAARSGDSSGGLQAFQQRLAAVRRSSANDVAGAPSVATQQVALPDASVATVPDNTGPNNGPSPPLMPDIHAAHYPSAESGQPTHAESSPVAPFESSPVAPFESRPVRPAESTPGTAEVSRAPVVSGPLPVSKRISIRKDEQFTSDDSTAGESNGSPTIAKSEPTPAAGVLFAQQSPILGVQTSGPRSVNVGKEAAYTISINNSGQTAVQDLTVSIKIPSWTDVVDARASNGAVRPASNTSSEPLIWQLSRLEPHSKEQLVLKLVPRDSRPFDLAVQWTFSPVASQAMVEVKEPKLTMSLAGPKEVLYGQSKVYKLSLSNPGTGDAENVVLFLSPVDGGSGAPTRHDLGIIRAGDNKLVEVELTARQAGTLQMKAAAMADGNLRAEVAEEIIVHRAGLKFVVSGPDSKYTSTAATFKIQVRNPGNATAQNVVLAAMLPVGAKYISSTGGQFLSDQNKVAWSMPSLAAGTEQELEVRCLLNAPGANRLQVVGSAGGDLSDSAAATTNVEALADLKLDVTDPQGPIPVGDEVVYEIHLRNRGTKAAENVDVAGYFSQGIEPVAAQGSTYQLSPGQVVFHPIASIAPGTEVLLRIKARAEKAGTHVFRAEVVCSKAGTKLATEETTLFFGENDHSPVRTAARPRPDTPQDDSAGPRSVMKN